MDNAWLTGVHLIAVSALSAVWVMRTPQPTRRTIAQFASVVLFFALVLFALIQQSPTISTERSSHASSSPYTAAAIEATSTQRHESPTFSQEIITPTIIRVIDGDTIVIRRSGEEETVRLIGIDAPEKKTSRKAAECFGPEATHKLTQLLPAGSSVTIISDPTQDIYDKYGRTLAYVANAQGLDVAETLLKEGYAYEYVYRVPYTRHQAFVKAETVARSTKAGLWSACE